MLGAWRAGQRQQGGSHGRKHPSWCPMGSQQLPNENLVRCGGCRGDGGGDTLFLMEMLPEQSKEHLKGLVVCGAQQPSQGSHGREFTAAHTAFTPASGRSGRWPSWATQPGDMGRQQPSQCPCPVQGGQVLIALAGHHSHLTLSLLAYAVTCSFSDTDPRPGSFSTSGLRSAGPCLLKSVAR